MRKGIVWGFGRMGVWVMVFVLFMGCGGEGPTLTPEGRKPIRLYMLLLSEKQVAHFRWVETAFEAEHPDVDVVFEQFPGSSLKDFEIKLRLQFASGKGPDVFFINEGVAAEFARFGLLAQAPAWMTKRADSISYNTAIRDAPYVEGVSYGLTSDIAPTVLYYNKQFFREVGLDPEQPPQTWDELIDYADRLTIRDAQGNPVRSGLSLRKTGFKPGTAEKWLTFLYSAGGEAFDAMGTRTLINSPAGREALDLYHTVLFDKKIDSVLLEGDQLGFGQGQTAMFIREVHVMRWLDANYPDLDYGVAPIPEKAASVSAGGAYVWVVSQDTPYQEASWQLVDFMMRHDVYARYANIGGVIPTVRSVAALPDYQEDAHMQVFLQQERRSEKPFPRMQQAYEVLGAYLERFCYGRIGADEMLQRAEADINGLLRTNQIRQQRNP